MFRISFHIINKFISIEKIVKMFKEYIHIFIFSGFLIIFTFLLIYLNYLIIQRKPNVEKDSSYECGFQAFDVIIDRFDIKYYIVALLFLIFDLELIFLLP